MLVNGMLEKVTIFVCHVFSPMFRSEEKRPAIDKFYTLLYAALVSTWLGVLEQ